MKLESLEDLFIHHLQDVYSAEKQITKALPKMAKASDAPELAEAFEKHLKETREHVQRLEKIFKGLDRSPGRVKCVGMEGLIEEGAELIEEEPPPAVLDAGLIGAAQRVEHYEIAAYGIGVEWAKLLGHGDAAKLLQKTLEEESAANEKLTALAEESVNEAAMQAAAVE